MQGCNCTHNIRINRRQYLLKNSLCNHQRLPLLSIEGMKRMEVVRSWTGKAWLYQCSDWTVASSFCTGWFFLSTISQFQLDEHQLLQGKGLWKVPLVFDVNESNNSFVIASNLELWCIKMIRKYMTKQKIASYCCIARWC